MRSARARRRERRGNAPRPLSREPARAHIRPASLKYLSAPGCSGADRPPVTISSLSRSGERGVQLLEVLEVLEHRLDHLIHRLIRHVRPGHEGGADAEGLDIVRVARVHAARDHRLREIGVLFDQGIDLRAAHRDQIGIHGGGRLLDRAVRVADDERDRVDVVVGQRRALLGRLQLGGEREVVHGPALGVHQHLEGGARAGAGIADVDPLALEIIEGRDAGIGAGEQSERLRVEREHRPQVRERTLAFELRADALEGVVLHVALYDAEVELALAHGVDVVDRAARALDRATDPVLLAVGIDQPADGAAGRIVDAGDAAGADGDELVFLGRGDRRGEKAAPAAKPKARLRLDRILISLDLP